MLKANVAFPWPATVVDLTARSLRTLGAILIATACGVAAAAATDHAASTADQMVNLNINDPRPVAQGALSLVARYGYQITYEDPPYRYEGDLVDRHVGTRKDRIPAGGALILRVPASTALDSGKVSEAVKQLLSQHAVGDRGGRFRLDSASATNVFHVIPTEIKDEAGNWVPVQPVLDVPITVPGQERVGMAMLDAICAAVSTASGIKVKVGTTPCQTKKSQTGAHGQPPGEIGRVSRRALAVREGIRISSGSRAPRFATAGAGRVG